MTDYTKLPPAEAYRLGYDSGYLDAEKVWLERIDEIEDLATHPDGRSPKDLMAAVARKARASRIVYGDPNCVHEWSGPLDKSPTCVKCSMAYPPALNLIGECRVLGPHQHAFIGPHRFNEASGSSDTEAVGLECPMCGGDGRIFDVTAAIEDAQRAGEIRLVEPAARASTRHFEAGRGVCVADGQPWPCSASSDPEAGAYERGRADERKAQTFLIEHTPREPGPVDLRPKADQ
jgi:hypothetical protein